MKKCVVNIPITWDKVSTAFFRSFLDITRFEIQEKLRKEHDITLHFMITDTFPLDRNRNEAVEMAVEQYKADYLLFLDADQVFPRETIPWLFESLFAKPEFDVVSGVYFKKEENNHSVCGHYAQDVDPESKKVLITNGFADENGQYLFYQPCRSFLHGRSFPIDVSGIGCLLIRTECLSRIKQPYFKYFDKFLCPGWPFKWITEDMLFFAKLKQAGIKVLCDPRVLCGHLKEAEIALVGDAVICA